MDTGITADTAIERQTQSSQQITELGAKETLEAYGANQAGTGAAGRATLLNGLEVVADARANTVTLIGTPRKVEIAASILSQLDVRRRQVAVNVKIIDVDLSKGKTSNADLQFRASETLGVGFRPDPANPGQSGFIGIVGSPFANNALSGAGVITNLARNFLGTIFASIQDSSAKILTNPTLIVQEGSSAQVNLTEEVFSGISQSSSAQGTAAGAAIVTVTTTPIIRPAGVILNVTVDQIDDNGFITLNVSPEVSVPSGTFEFSFPGSLAAQTGTLLAQRRLETGKIRLRDGQTLVLTGIIQDQDQSSVSKVPILGDIPLLGRLFRRESSTRQRSELVVMVTPQVMNDSQQATFGYQYTPGPEVDKLLNPQR